MLASSSDSGSMTSRQGAATLPTPGVPSTTSTTATDTNNTDGMQPVSEGRTDQATGDASVNRTNDGIEMEGTWDGTTGDDFIALGPEMATAETPGGFSKFAFQISGEAMKRSGDGLSQVTMGTRSQDGSLWVDGIRFPCKEAYELWLVASVRGETWARVMAMHSANKVDADSWKRRLKPCPTELVETEQRSLDTFQRWWTAQDGTDLSIPAELTIPKSALSTATRMVQTTQDAATINAVKVTTQKDPNILEVSTKDTHTVLVTMGIVNGRTVRVLNDSGADASVMSEQCARRLNLNIDRGQDLPTLRNPNGDGLHCIGVVNTTILMAEQHLQLKAYVVTDLTIDLLVGGDFLRMHKANLSYSDLSVSYHGVEAKMYEESRSERKAYKRSHQASVVTTEDVTLQGDMVVSIQAAVQCSTKYIRSAKSWEFVPLRCLALECGVLMPHALVTVDKDGMIPVKIRLAFSSEMILTKGTVLGTLKIIEEDLNVRPIVVNNGSMETTTAETVSPKAPRQADEEKFANLLERTLKNLPPDIDDMMKADMVKVLTKHKATLCAKTLGETSVTTFDMELGPGGPIRHGDRRWSHEELAIMKEQIDLLQKMGMIEHSNSDWASRLVMVTKKDGSTRVCVDYREVNKLTKRDAYPAPQIEQTLDQLRKAKYYTSLDGEKGYYQVKMTDRAKEVTAFRSPFGLFQFLRMPFGLTNAPAVFQRLMDKVLRGLTWNCCMVYLDDIIIYSNTWEEHIKHIDMVLQRISDANITLNSKKCDIGQVVIKFLGHVVSAEGIKPDADRATAIQDLKVPTDVTGVRSFLGMTNQFRKFIRGYADLARPLNSVATDASKPRWKDGTAWGHEQQMAFEALKYVVSQNTMLAHPDFTKSFLLVTDASNKGVGAMLAQLDDAKRERPIAFASAELNPAQRNYSATHKEGLAVVWAVERFKPYIHGMHTVVVTDHSALTWLLAHKEPSQRMARWTMTLMDYNLQFIHRKGKYNTVADALSRLHSKSALPSIDVPTEESLTPLMVFTTRRSRRGGQNATQGRDIPEDAVTCLDSKEQEEWKRAQRDDNLCSIVTKYLRDGVLPTNDNDQGWVTLHGHEFVIQQGIVCRVLMVKQGRTTTLTTKIVVPKSKVTELVMGVHTSVAEGGHQGAARIYSRLAQHYWWPRMYSDVKDLVTACMTCQVTGKAPIRQATIGGSFVGTTPFEVVAVDLMAMPESWAGNKYLMVVEDYLSNYVVVAPIKDKRAETIADVFLNQVILIYGPPGVIHSDRGSEFRNKVMAELCDIINAKKSFTTPYHPQADGKVERFNRTIQRLLACYVAKGQRNWDIILPFVLYAYNTTTGRKHGRSPFNILYGHDPKSPFLRRLLDGESQLPRSPTQEWLRHVETHKAYIAEVINSMDQEARDKSHEYANQSRREPPKYKPGTLIWVKNHMKLITGSRPKLQRQFRGPYIVIKMVGAVTVMFKPIASTAEPDTIHVDNTKPFVTTAGKPVTLATYEDVIGVNPEDEDIVDEEAIVDDSATYIVEKVVDHRLKDGTIEFLLQWKGYGPTDNTWTKEADMSCHSLVEDYFQTLGAIPDFD